MKSNLLVEALRAGIQEKRFYGWVMVVDKNVNVLSTLEQQDYFCFMRSCEKPIQSYCAFKLHAVDKFNLKPPEIALSFASHIASQEHIDYLKSIMTKLGVTERELLCGAHMPFDEAECKRLIKNDLTPSVLHNNCSGKHLFVIASCLAQGWSLPDYTEFDHPVQKEITRTIEHFCQIKDVVPGIDGCGMPVHAMNLANMGAGFAKFFDGEDHFANQIADAVTKYPHLAGGKGRIDSSIIEATNGKIIAKVGAEGLLIITLRYSGEALVVKMAAGIDYMRNLVAIEAMRQLGWFDFDIETNQIITPFAKSRLYSHSGKEVGEYKFTFTI